MNIYYPGHTKHRKRSRRRLFLVVGLVVVAFGVYWIGRDNKTEPSAKNSTQASEKTESEPKKPAYTPINLQPTVDSWVAKQAATYGIVVYDPQAKKVIGSNLPDQKYFAASLYKLFVAYLALKDFQTGEQKPDEMLTGGFSRKQCVDKMIRESHSPCGEAMMADMGPSSLATRVKAMGINNTTFVGISTTAQDSALILQYILEKRDLNEENTVFLKDAMRIQEQRFRKGLAGGAPEATWETKVGWNEQSNYHDVGIMTLSDGRQFVVAILSQDNGSSAPIANFAATIYTALTQ